MNIVAKLKRVINQILGMIPSQVPQGLSEFDAWTKSIVDTYSPPGNERSIRFVLSSLLMRLNPDEAYKSKWFFARSLQRAAASQVAVYVQEDIKNQQKAEALAAQQQAEATAQAASDEEQQISI